MVKRLNSLKIGIIRDGPPGCPGGVIARELFWNLKDNLNNIEEVMCIRLRESRKIRWNIPPTRIITYRTKHLRDSQILWKLPRYDLYHFQSHVFSSLIKHRRPSIATAIDLIPLKGGFYSGTHLEAVRRSFQFFKDAEQIIAISQSTKKDLIKLLDIDPEKIKVIYLGVNHEIYRMRNRKEAKRTLGLPEDKRILLNVGTENKNKNIKRLIKVFHRLQKRFKDLLLIRVGLTSNEISDLIAELGLTKKVLRVGFIEGYPNLYYNASDIYVCSDLLGGFGMPNLEAMASGCPVVTSRTGAFPEVVGEAGLFFDPRDEDDIFEKIATLLENSKLREEYAQKGLERAKLFSWKKMADETMKVYAKVAKECYGKNITVPEERRR
ncbi:glycosyltransferase family 4 protein [bacterium]|nr:glycosyltransferase family 4 protein [bacterium]